MKNTDKGISKNGIQTAHTVEKYFLLLLIVTLFVLVVLKFSSNQNTRYAYSNLYQVMLVKPKAATGNLPSNVSKQVASKSPHTSKFITTLKQSVRSLSRLGSPTSTFPTSSTISPLTCTRLFLSSCKTRNVKLYVLNPNLVKDWSSTNLPTLKSGPMSVGVFSGSVRGLKAVLSSKGTCFKITTVANHTVLSSQANGRYLLHIVVIAKAADYYLIPDFPKDQTLSWKSLPIAKQLPLPAAFPNRTFDRAVEITDLHVYLPADRQKYLVQAGRSHFMPCNQTSADAYRKRTAVGKASSSKRESARSLLRDVGPVLEKLNMTFWLSSGTLLGWYRECDIIPYTEDVDTQIMISDLSPDFVSTFQRRRPTRLWYRFGTEDEGLEYSLFGFGMKMDIFMVYKSATGIWIGAMYYSGCKKFRYGYTTKNFRLCSTEFLGDLRYIPCDVHDFIREEYGKDTWDKPNERYNWKQTKNMVSQWQMDSSKCRQSFREY